MRRQFDFIITGTPFCGYAATAKVLNDIGIGCSVEKSINDWWAMMDLDPKNEIEGDCSWFAAPYLDFFKDSTIILHQTVNPSRFIEEAERSRLFNNWETDYLYSHKTDFSANKFIKYQGREWNWPNSTRERIELFYTKWNLLIEEKAQGKKYMRYRVEDFGEELLERICWFLGTSFSGKNVGRFAKSSSLDISKALETNQELKNICFRYDYLPFSDKSLPFNTA